MSLSAMQIVGLSNVRPSQPTVSGTTVTAGFAFGGVTSLPPGIAVPADLVIQGTFAIALSCCPSSDGTMCSGPSASQPITGTFTVELVGAVLSMTLDVDSSFAVTVNSLSLTATPHKFTFKADRMSGEINPLLQNAFKAAGSQKALGLINDRLASQATLTALGGVLTPAFQSLSNPSCIAFIASLLYRNAINPNSSRYLPTAISQATNPVLDPYDAGGWQMDDIGQWYPKAGETICGSIGATDNKNEIQTPDTAVTLDLVTITISGTSNLLPVPMLTVNDTVFGLAACNAVKGWPKTFTVSGTFELTVSCCEGKRGTPGCIGPSATSTGTGTFAARFATATVAASLTMSASPVVPEARETSTASEEKLVATVDALYFGCDPIVSNVTIDIDITSIPAGQRDAWNNVAIGIFNSAPAISAIVDQIRTRINGEQVRAKLSEIVTAAIQKILADDPELAARVKADIATRRSK